MLTINYRVRKDRVGKDGRAPIQIRVHYQSAVAAASTGKRIEPSRWDEGRRRVKGKTQDAININKMLDWLEARLDALYRQAVDHNRTIDVAELLNRAKRGDVQIKPKAMAYIDAQVERMKSLVGVDYVIATVTKYSTVAEHFRSYLYENDMDPYIDEIKSQVVHGFLDYLKSEGIRHNTALKYLEFVGSFFNRAVQEELIQVNPFSNMGIKKRKVEIEYLTAGELKAVQNEYFVEKEGLTRSRDLFIFSCYTGLAYGDAQRLTPDHLEYDLQTGINWITIQRKKLQRDGGGVSIIPVLPPAQQIIDRYATSRWLLPRISNQKFNKNLKQIAKIAGVKKKLTTHIARHTFATTVTLSNGVPLEAVSKMMGHASLKQTQHYAKVTKGLTYNSIQPLLPEADSFAQG